MITLTVYTIAAFGFAYIIGHAMITRSLREWAYDFGLFYRMVELETTDVVSAGSTALMPRVYPLRWFVQLIECPACLGFHTGFWSWLWYSRDPVAALLAGCFVAGSNYLLGRQTGLIPPKEN